MVVVPDPRPAPTPHTTTVRAHPIRAAASTGLAARAVGIALLPPMLLALFTILVFFDELTGGPVAYGQDTTAFYYPLTEWTAGQVRDGRLPLWIPLIFGGYPLLADGEVGPLYPPNLLLLTSLTVAQAYAVLRALHFGIAAVGLYVLARSLGAGPLGAVIGGLAFGYGSFVVGHLQHDNILRSSAWLPWLLLAAELALRSTGSWRVFWTLIGALVLALQCLGVHIQPVLLSLLALGAYLLGGPLGRPPEAPAARALSRGWLLARIKIGAGIVGLGFGLATMQLLPLYQLGQRSMRPNLVTYDYATSYAVSPPQLLTLLFPYMFNFDAERAWALWSPHETTLYVGVAPFLLAIVAVGFMRTRAVLFFGAVAASSLILSLGDYVPIKLYALIWNLPGFAYLRAPARFGLLFELAMACLAALAVEWLARRARAGGAPRGLSSLLVGLSLSSVALALAISGLRWWLQRTADPLAVLEGLRIGLQTSKENWLLGPWHVYYGLIEFARPSNSRTALGIALLAGVPLILRAWVTSPSRAAWWRTALLGLVVADLWFFATGFYPRARLDDLRPSSPALDVLASQPGPFWVFVEPELNRILGANQLVSRGLPTINGYSSLEPRRFSEYWWSIVAQDNVLLDLFNVRYVLAAPRAAAGQRTDEGTSYHPTDRLMSGQAGNRSGLEQFHAPAGRVENVTVVAAVEGLAAADGTPVAEVILHGMDGTSLTLPLRAGIEVGEYRAAEPGRPTAGYTGPRVVWAGPSFTPEGPGKPARLYGARLAVSPSLDVAGVSVRALVPTGRLHLHGLGLRNAEGAVTSVRSSNNVKYRLLYADADVLLLENRAAWPRAFAVGGAASLEAGVPLIDQLLGRPWDPEREILVEGTPPAGTSAESGDPVGAAGRAEVLTHRPGQMVARTDLDRAGYLVLSDRYEDGWRAWVEDRELPILRANGIQQAVALPAGSHTVTFIYDPWWVKLGFGLSGLSMVLWLGALAVTVLPIPAITPTLFRRPARS